MNVELLETLVIIESIVHKLNAFAIATEEPNFAHPSVFFSLVRNPG
jgi:hypothetical protein